MVWDRVSDEQPCPFWDKNFLQLFHDELGKGGNVFFLVWLYLLKHLFDHLLLLWTVKLPAFNVFEEGFISNIYDFSKLFKFFLVYIARVLESTCQSFLLFSPFWYCLSFLKDAFFLLLTTSALLLICTMLTFAHSLMCGFFLGRGFGRYCSFVLCVLECCLQNFNSQLPQLARFYQPSLKQNMLQLIWVLSCSSKMLNLSKLWLLLQCYCYSGQSQKLLLCSWASCWVASWKPWLVSKNLLLLPTFSKAYPTFLRVAEACYCCYTFWPTSIPHNTHLGDCLLHWRRCLFTYPSLFLAVHWREVFLFLFSFLSLFCFHEKLWKWCMAWATDPAKLISASLCNTQWPNLHCILLLFCWLLCSHTLA